MIGLEARWIGFWKRLTAAGDALPIFNDLTRRYGEPCRAYHTLAHIENCLNELDGFPDALANRDAIEFALWFHDAIYDPKAKDNEERSAEMALAVAHSASLSQSFAAEVRRLILATRHTSIPETRSEQVLVDIDLSILGQDAEEFDQYERQIRHEYDWVPVEAFAKGRSAILQSFLDRPRIYSTEFFRAKYESSARVNLTRSIEKLAT